MTVRRAALALARAWRAPTVGSLTLTRKWEQGVTGLPPRHERPGINRTAFEMLRHYDRQALEALEELLKAEDPPDLCGRGSRTTVEGKETRRRDWLPIRVKAMYARELAGFGMDWIAPPSAPIEEAR